MTPIDISDGQTPTPLAWSQRDGGTYVQPCLDALRLDVGGFKYILAALENQNVREDSRRFHVHQLHFAIPRIYTLKTLDQVHDCMLAVIKLLVSDYASKLPFIDKMDIKELSKVPGGDTYEGSKHDIILTSCMNYLKFDNWRNRDTFELICNDVGISGFSGLMDAVKSTSPPQWRQKITDPILEATKERNAKSSSGINIKITEISSFIASNFMTYQYTELAMILASGMGAFRELLREEVCLAIESDKTFNMMLKANLVTNLYNRGVDYLKNTNLN